MLQSTNAHAILRKVLCLFFLSACYTFTGFSQNTATGDQALINVSTGTDNTATGAYSLHTLVGSSFNTATGKNSLYFNSNGEYNVANGISSLYLNTGGSKNTAIGGDAMFNNTNGSENTSLGFQSLYSNTTGGMNVALGTSALFYNSSGEKNTAGGYGAMTMNQGGSFNTAFGAEALTANNTGLRNTAIGYQALTANNGGNRNTAVGNRALHANTSGSWNVAIGHNALEANTTGINNTAIGRGANRAITGYDNTTAIGNGAQTTASNEIYLGNAFVTSISGAMPFAPLSDERFKVNIQEEVMGLEFINALRPVTYKLDLHAIEDFYEENYGIVKEEDWEGKYDNEKVIQTGFIAQEVEAAAQALGYDFSGVDAPKNDKDFYGLRYSQFVVPLTKAVQELSTKVEQLESLLRQQTELVASLQAQNKASNNPKLVSSNTTESTQ